MLLKVVCNEKGVLSGRWQTFSIGLVAIDVCLSLNFAVVFEFNLFLFPSSKDQFLGVCHLPGPPSFSLQTTFKSMFNGYCDKRKCYLMHTFCNSNVLWLLRCVLLRLVTVTFCDINVVWGYVMSQYRSMHNCTNICQNAVKASWLYQAYNHMFM